MAESAKFGDKRIRPIGEAEIVRANTLFHDKRNISLITAKDPDANGITPGHSTVLYSTITRRLSPGGRTIQVAWRSHEYDPDLGLNEHSWHIERDRRTRAAMGLLAVAPVSFNLYEADGADVSVKLYGEARKIDDPAEAMATLDVVNDYRHGRVRDTILSLEPDNEWGAPYFMYIADIDRVTVPADMEQFTPQGWVPVDYGHAPVENLTQLRGFDFPPRPKDAAS